MTQAVEHTRCQRSTSRRRTDSRPSCFLGSNKLLRGPEFFELAQTRQCGYNLLHSLNSYARLSVLPNFRHPAAQMYHNRQAASHSLNHTQSKALL